MMKGRLYLFFCIFLVIIAGCNKIEKKEAAILNEFEGEVFVNQKPALKNMQLKESDIIKTGKSGEAEIIFYDGAALRLNYNTEVIVSKLDLKNVEVKQNQGETWTKLLKISGISRYNIVTPQTIASVRGTGFKISVEKDKTEVGVNDGIVHVAKIEDSKIVDEIDVKEKQEAIIEKEDEEIEITKFETDEWVEENVKEDEEFVEEKVEEYLEEHPEIVEGLEGKELSEDQIEDVIEGVITGEIEEHEVESGNVESFLEDHLEEFNENIEDEAYRDFEETDYESTFEEASDFEDFESEESFSDDFGEDFDDSSDIGDFEEGTGDGTSE